MIYNVMIYLRFDYRLIFDLTRSAYGWCCSSKSCAGSSARCSALRRSKMPGTATGAVVDCSGWRHQTFCILKKAKWEIFNHFSVAIWFCCDFPLWHIIYVLAMLDFLAPHRIPADCAKEQWPLIMNIGKMSANTLNLWKDQQPVAPSRIISHHPSHLGFPCWNGSAPRHVFECLHDALHTAWDESKRGVLDVASRC